MKKRYLFYSIATLAVIALIVGIISYATETRPTQTDVTTAPVEKTVAAEKQASAEITDTVKKKNCGCCAEGVMQRWKKLIAKQKRTEPGTTQGSQAGWDLFTDG